MAKLADFHTAMALSALLFCHSVFAMPDIHVNGLMNNQAIVTIDGKQRILKVGKPSTEGVNLISANSKKAIFEWQGESFERTVDKKITSNFAAPTEKNEVRIEKASNGHFNTPGHINGRLVNFMVDTGAFAIAMNQVEADRLGVNWRNGERFLAGTAGGGTPGYKIVLDTVTIGDITLHSVQAAVIVADTDTDILLGMSFLSQTEMREENNALVLRKKF